MKLLILYNKESKKQISNKKFEYLKKELSELYEEIIIPDIKENERTTDYVNLECDTILIIGGDGTVHDVISEVLKQGLKRNFCFIPAGTCNDYSRNFGYTSFKKSVRIIKDNNIIKKDVYKINDSYFVYGLASGGISMISYDVKEKEKRKQGKLAYYIRILKYILKSPANSYYEIEYNANYIKDNFYLILAVDSLYLGGFKLKKNIRNNFQLILFKRRNKLRGCISFASFILFGRIAKKDTVIKTDTFKLKTLDNINTDGELFPSSDIEVSKFENQINIISNRK